MLKTTTNSWLFIGTDSRLSTCSKIMKGLGYEANHYNGNSFSTELSTLIDELAPSHIVLPIIEMEEMIPAEKFPKGATVYPGIISSEWLSKYEEAHIPVHSYIKEVEYVWENARLTAEGFLLEYYESTKQSVFGKQFCITGFGKVAKMMAEVLSAMGGTVAIMARSSEQLGEAAALGYKTCEFNPTNLSEHKTLINTVPARWLKPDDKQELRIFDLASAPGCLKENAPDEYYTIHLGLPGKHFPIDAANALAKALLRMNSA